ncbi:hypothetical protein HNY73_000329 [Argiope bruennichi]|uniref:Uncharacterized protein n=1 Tax=Argiope bruennichi TaxID=94029 RepID=A0A8T0G0D4_ARGBR|nr:hypothetical protein HNY73_000329 [Argiope bruennichi]
MERSFRKNSEQDQEWIRERKWSQRRSHEKVEIFEKLKNLKVEISDKIKSIFEDMKKKMGRNGPKLNDVRLSNFFGQLERLKELINEELDYEKLKEKVQEMFGRGSEFTTDVYFRIQGKLLQVLRDSYGISRSMKYLVVFLLVGLGFTSAYPTEFDDALLVDRFDQADRPMHAGGWIAERMRESLQVMVDGFEKALKEGKTISERAFKKAEELYHTLLDWGIDVGEEIKEALERIGQEFDKNRPDRADRPLHVGNWIAERMRESLQVMVDGFEKALKEGKTISERAFRKAEELYHKLLDWGIEVGEEIKEAIERIGREFEKNSLDRADNPMHVGDWITDRMRDSLQVMIDSFEKALKEGKTISERAFRKAEELYHKLLDWGVDVGEEIKEAIERIGREFERNSPDRADNSMHVGDWITDRMRDSLQVMIDSFEKAIKEGKTISERAFKKAEELYHKLLDWGIDVGEEIKEALDRIRGEIEKNA